MICSMRSKMADAGFVGWLRAPLNDLLMIMIIKQIYFEVCFAENVTNFWVAE